MAGRDRGLAPARPGAGSRHGRDAVNRAAARRASPCSDDRCPQPASRDLPAPFTATDPRPRAAAGSLSRVASSRAGGRGWSRAAWRRRRRVLLAQPADQAVAQKRTPAAAARAGPRCWGCSAAAAGRGCWPGSSAGRCARLASAARQLYAGDRDGTGPAEGPAEVADVGQALNGLAVALAGSEHRQRRFLMDVSHELRTPLTAVGRLRRGPGRRRAGRRRGPGAPPR